MNKARERLLNNVGGILLVLTLLYIFNLLINIKYNLGLFNINYNRFDFWEKILGFSTGGVLAGYIIQKGIEYEENKKIQKSKKIFISLLKGELELIKNQYHNLLNLADNQDIKIEKTLERLLLEGNKSKEGYNQILDIEQLAFIIIFAIKNMYESIASNQNINRYFANKNLVSVYTNIKVIKTVIESRRNASLGFQDYQHMLLHNFFEKKHEGKNKVELYIEKIENLILS